MAGKEYKELLLKDLCARLPYQPLCKKVDTEDDFCECDAPLGYSLRDLVDNKIIIKPYLHPMSSMTEEEDKEFALLQTDFYTDGFLYPIAALNLINWLNAHHFDYRGLIERGLAIAVTEENNPYKE